MHVRFVVWATRAGIGQSRRARLRADYWRAAADFSRPLLALTVLKRCAEELFLPRRIRRLPALSKVPLEALAPVRVVLAVAGAVEPRIRMRWHCLGSARLRSEVAVAAGVVRPDALLVANRPLGFRTQLLQGGIVRAGPGGASVRPRLDTIDHGACELTPLQRNVGPLLLCPLGLVWFSCLTGGSCRRSSGGCVSWRYVCADATRLRRSSVGRLTVGSNGGGARVGSSSSSGGGDARGSGGSSDARLLGGSTRLEHTSSRRAGQWG